MIVTAIAFAVAIDTSLCVTPRDTLTDAERPPHSSIVARFPGKPEALASWPGAMEATIDGRSYLLSARGDEIMLSGPPEREILSTCIAAIRARPVRIALIRATEKLSRFRTRRHYTAVVDWLDRPDPGIELTAAVESDDSLDVIARRGFLWSVRDSTDTIPATRSGRFRFIAADDAPAPMLAELWLADGGGRLDGTLVRLERAAKWSRLAVYAKPPEPPLRSGSVPTDTLRRFLDVVGAFARDTADTLVHTVRLGDVIAIRSGRTPTHELAFEATMQNADDGSDVMFAATAAELAAFVKNLDVVLSVPGPGAKWETVP